MDAAIGKRPKSLSPPHVVNIYDLRRKAKSRLPKAVFDYVDGAAEDEVTYRANTNVFEFVQFRPRTAVSFPQVDLRTKVLGSQLELPFLLAPVGSTRMLWPRGEVHAAAAAGAAGTAYTLSTLSGTNMEEVAQATKGPLWYQLYLAGGREVGKAGLQRALRTGFTTLLVTVDTAVSGMRERDFHNGTLQLLSRNPFTMFPYVWQVLSRPRWLLNFLLDGGLMEFPNVMLPSGPMQYADVSLALEEAAVTWDDLHWIRKEWPGPIAVKGILTREDALKALDYGVQGVIVSNHGGRQLDTVPASLQALPEVVAAVGDRLEVLMDGGIRRGSDVVKALCMGARAVLVGRAFAYGLGAAGQAGVARAIEILRADVIRTMKLLGCPSVAELNSSYIRVLPGLLADLGQNELLHGSVVRGVR
jgi:isopentenyl diphosphate isomerase/L-lactate dehydrogenase-like FMN-dependent dehydrogenase